MTTDFPPTFSLGEAMKKLLVGSSMCLMWLALPAYAQYAKTEGLPIRLGDSVSQVQTALHTDVQPEPFDSPINKGGSALRLRTKGIWVFFNKDGKASTIRLDAPFSGNVSGIKIGDMSGTLLGTLGQPIKPPFKFGQNQSYLYYPDDTYSARFDVNPLGSVETILIFK